MREIRTCSLSGGRRLAREVCVRLLRPDCGDYTDLLKDNDIDISMSRKANPWDNAGCESFMKTLKQEEVYRTEYRNMIHARAEIGEFLEKLYNEKRLHSALDYRSPVQFERTLVTRTEPEAARVSA